MTILFNMQTFCQKKLIKTFVIRFFLFPLSFNFHQKFSMGLESRLFICCVTQLKHFNAPLDQRQTGVLAPSSFSSLYITNIGCCFCPMGYFFLQVSSCNFVLLFDLTAVAGHPFFALIYVLKPQKAFV